MIYNIIFNNIYYNNYNLNSKMEKKYNSPVSNNRYLLSKKKIFTPTFRYFKLYKSNKQSSNAIIDIQNLSNFSFKIKRKQKIKLKRERVEFSSDDLRNDLMTTRSEVIKRKNELLNLKIKYGKLMIDNINNKTFLADILGIPKDKYITKRTIIHKINICKLNKEKKESLKSSYEILNLKSELYNKKKLFSEKSKYLELLNKNSKIKNLSNLQDEYNNKCKRQKNLLKKLSNLGVKYTLQQNLVSEINEKIKSQNKTCENLIEKESKGVDIINQMLDQKVTLINQIYFLNDRIKKHKKSHFSKVKEILEKEKNNSFDEKKLFKIKQYTKCLPKEKNSISQMTKTKEDDESILKNYSEEIGKLQKEYNNLFLKLNNYKEEKPKLIFKSKEPKKNIEKMESLKKELNKLKEFRIETEQKHISIQNELKEKNNSCKKDNEIFNKKIEDNIKTKNDLNKKILELKEIIEKLRNKNIDIKSKTNQGKEEYEKLCQNEKELKSQIEQNSLIYQENMQNMEKEKQINANKLKKKRKKDIDNLKKEQNKLILFKKNVEDANNYLTQELNEFNQGLIEYEKIEKELTDAEYKLNNLKKK